MTAFQIMNGILDTASLMRHLHPEILQNLSLKKIVALYLHFNMIKAQQLSDWGRRPLQEKQINYAACDCLVLLRLYDAMICEAEEESDNAKHFDIKKVLVHYDSNNVVDVEKKKRKNKKKKPSSSNQGNQTNHIFGKEIPCSIVESTGVHTHFDDKDTQNTETNTCEDDINTRLRKRKLNPNHSPYKKWAPIHSGRTVMVVGMNKKHKNTWSKI